MIDRTNCLRMTDKGKQRRPRKIWTKKEETWAGYFLKPRVIVIQDSDSDVSSVEVIEEEIEQESGRRGEDWGYQIVGRKQSTTRMLNVEACYILLLFADFVRVYINDDYILY